jgi:hypothetical protein
MAEVRASRVAHRETLAGLSMAEQKRFIALMQRIVTARCRHAQEAAMPRARAAARKRPSTMRFYSAARDAPVRLAMTCRNFSASSSQ